MPKKAKICLPLVSFWFSKKDMATLFPKPTEKNSFTGVFLLVSSFSGRGVFFPFFFFFFLVSKRRLYCEGLTFSASSSSSSFSTHAQILLKNFAAPQKRVICIPGILNSCSCCRRLQHCQKRLFLTKRQETKKK